MDFVDSYWNVTLDSVSAIKFAREWRQYSHNKNASSKLEFVVLGDDDTYINVPSLWSRLFYEAKDVISFSLHVL